MIILFGGEKGGTGKTTIATNIAVMRTHKNKDVMLIDTDKQQSASYFCSLREDNKIYPRVSSIQKFDRAVKTEALELKKKYKDIIIDAGGRDSVELRSALLIADRAFFPLRASQYDMWTLKNMNDHVDTAKLYNPKLEVFIILNQLSSNPAVKEIESAKELIKEFEQVDLLSTFICERIEYRKAALSGMSVVERGQDIKAINEMKNLYQEIYNESA